MQWEKVINYFGFYRENGNSKEQMGIVRVNCLDCLDRTNALQTVIAWKILTLIVFRKHNIAYV